MRDLPWTTAVRVPSVLTGPEPADRQNDAPSLGAVLVAAVGHPAGVEVHGYLVPPCRDEERLTAGGVAGRPTPGRGRR